MSDVSEQIDKILKNYDNAHTLVTTWEERQQIRATAKARLLNLLNETYERGYNTGYKAKKREGKLKYAYNNPKWGGSKRMTPPPAQPLTTPKTTSTFIDFTKHTKDTSKEKK